MNFPALTSGTATVSIDVVVKEDAMVECDEIFEILLALVTTGVGVTTENTTTLVTLVDSDGMYLVQ